jgi:outer membrane lipoprotein SlyB
LGRIDNLRLVNADVSGQGVYTPELGGALIGGMVSENSGTMFGDSISGVVSAIAPAPEAAPEPARRIQNFSGGLVGGNDGWIFSSRSTATVKGAGGSVLGGLVGDGHGGITDSYFAGTVIMDNWGIAGGLIGSIAAGSITSSFSSGSVIGRGPNAVLGGLVGSEGAATNSNCYSTASVTGTGSRPQIGGLIGIGEVEAGSLATS